MTIRIRHLVAGMALLVMAAGCSGRRPPLTADMIRYDLAGVRARYFLPSLGVAVITDDDIVLMGPVGKARIDTDSPVMPGSYYQTGSCTKAMTATALVRLMKDLGLSWETRLLDLFPEFVETAQPAFREITLGEIALHRAGFSKGGDVATIERMRDYRGSLTGYLGELLRQQPKVRKGRFLYSNNGYAALGAVIERCTGLSYAEAMRKLVFEPLGIKAHFGFPADLGPNQPWGYTSNWGAAAPARPVDEFIANMLWPAGGVSLTLADFARFVQLHLRGMIGQEDSGYSPDLIRQLHKPRLIDNTPAGPYAAGWIVRKLNGEMIQWHNGSTGDFMTYMAINRARKKGVVVVTNVGGTQGEQAGWDIVETLLTHGSGTVISSAPAGKE